MAAWRGGVSHRIAYPRFVQVGLTGNEQAAVRLDEMPCCGAREVHLAQERQSLFLPFPFSELIYTALIMAERHWARSRLHRCGKMADENAMAVRLPYPVLTALMLAACSPSGEVADDAPAAEATAIASHIVPRAYRGRWAEMPAACLTHNSRRYEIAAGRIDSGQFGGKVEHVRIIDDTAVVWLALDGAEVLFTLTLEDSNSMRASYGKRDPFTLTRCR